MTVLVIGLAVSGKAAVDSLKAGPLQEMGLTMEQSFDASVFIYRAISLVLSSSEDATDCVPINTGRPDPASSATRSQTAVHLASAVANRRWRHV